MRTAHLLLAGGLALALAGLACADPKPQEAIVGKWEPQDSKGKVTIEFFKGGKLKVTDGEKVIEGTYKFVSEDTVEVTLTFGTDTKTEKLKVDLRPGKAPGRHDQATHGDASIEHRDVSEHHAGRRGPGRADPQDGTVGRVGVGAPSRLP